MGVKMKCSRSLTFVCVISCILGILLSIYAYHVETIHETDPSYIALCDFSEHISCSKVFGSRYGKGFGLLPSDSVINQPNSVYGMVFYLTQAALAVNTTELGVQIAFAFAVICLLGCVYLAAILYFVLEDLCVVCVSTYIINVIILVCCYLRYREIGRKSEQYMKTKKTKKT